MARLKRIEGDNQDTEYRAIRRLAGRVSDGDFQLDWNRRVFRAGIRWFRDGTEYNFVRYRYLARNQSARFNARVTRELPPDIVRQLLDNVWSG